MPMLQRERRPDGWHFTIDMADNEEAFAELEDAIDRRDHAFLAELIRSVWPKGIPRPDFPQLVFNLHDPREDCVRIVVMDDGNRDGAILH